jgi:hypothetical protein
MAFVAFNSFNKLAASKQRKSRGGGGGGYPMDYNCIIHSMVIY